MPTYDYECRGCGKSFEIFQKMSEAPKTTCPDCGEERMERLIGAGAGFIFKGSGFYITDYRSSDYKARAKAEAGGSGGASSTASSSTSATAGAAKTESKGSTSTAATGSSK